jgi:FkbM family methyltransferase
MDSILDISFDKKTAQFTFKSKTKNTFKASITVSDVHVGCVYFLWEDIEINSDFSGWLVPLEEKLMKVILNNPAYPGFNFKVYGPNKRLLQSTSFYLNKTSALIKLPFITPNNDMVGPSYVDFFYSDLCRGIDFSGVILDAGANVGFFTAFAKTKGAKRIYSVEPDPSAFDCLEKNFIDDPNVICLNKALSDRTDIVLFDLSLGSSVSSTINKYNKQTETHTIFIESFSLSTFFMLENNINLLKLDIEGAEYEVLNALSSYYYKKINQIFLEFHGDPKPLFHKLEKEGYIAEYRDSDENSNSGFIYAKRP